MTIETVSETRAHGGTQGVYRHASTVTGTPMTFAVFVPEHAPGTKLPVLWYLSGLTCTHANVTEKGEYRSACAEAGIIFVAPDTNRDVIVRYIVDQGTINPSADANWSFKPLADTTAVFESGPKGRQYAALVKGAKIEDAGDGENGFAKFRLVL